MMFTIGRARSRIGIATGAVVTVLFILGGLALGQGLNQVDAQVGPPKLGDLREAPQSYVLPAQRWDSFEEFAKAADFVGIVRVEDSEVTKTGGITSSITGLEMGSGYAEVTATVQRVIKGSEQQGQSFRHDVFFLPGPPGSLELDSPSFMPPLEVNGEYLVFVKNGSVMWPGGIYAVENGRVWFIGFWTEDDERQYPGPLSGGRSSDVSGVIADAVSE